MLIAKRQKEANIYVKKGQCCNERPWCTDLISKVCYHCKDCLNLVLKGWSGGAKVLRKNFSAGASY